jgi:hypothetical protein
MRRSLSEAAPVLTVKDLARPVNPMKNTPSGLLLDAHIKPQRAPWRMLRPGSTVWAPFGEYGWRPGIVTGLGKNHGDRTVVHLSFETGGKSRRVAGELYWRKPELKGTDKPSLQPVSA